MSTLETLIPSSTDGELLTLWSTHKNPLALEMLVQRHGGLVYSLCQKLLRNPPEIEDGFQTVFLLLTQHAHQIRRRDSVASWLYSVTVRVCKRMSQVRSRVAARLPENLPASIPMSFSQVEFHETSELLARELERLPVKLREPLVLVYLEGHSRASVAELLNTTEDGIKCRLARGRKMLRSRLLKRGVTFAIAFTASSSMIAEAATEATVAVPTALLKGTIESCQAGELLAPLSSTPVSLSSFESTTLLNQGALMTSTAWQTLAVTTAVAIVIAIGGSSATHGDSKSSAGQKSVNFDVGDSAFSPMLTVNSVQSSLATEIAQEEQPAKLEEPVLGLFAAAPQEIEELTRNEMTVVDFAGESVYPFNEKPTGERVDVYRMPADAHLLPKPTPRKLYDGIQAIYDPQAQVLRLRALSSNHEQAQLEGQEQNPLIVVPHGMPMARMMTAVQQNRLEVTRAPLVQPVTGEIAMLQEGAAITSFAADPAPEIQQAEEARRLLQSEVDTLNAQVEDARARMAELVTRIEVNQTEVTAEPLPTERAPIPQAEMQNQVYAIHDQAPLFAAVSNHPLADVERQRLVKLMDTVSQKQLDLELQHDELVLAGESDEHRLNKLKQMIEIHKKKLDDFRNEYRLIDQPPAPPAAPPTAWAPAAPADIAAAPPEVQPYLAVGVDLPSDPNLYINRGDAIELQLTSELPVKVHQHQDPYAATNPGDEWNRVDLEAPLKFSVFPSDSKQYELKVNRIGAPKMATLRIRPDIQEELREKLQNYEITLTRKDLDQLNANQPVVKTFSATGKSGEYKGVDTEFTWDIKAENAPEHEIHDRVLHMMTHGTPDQNNQPIIWGVLIIEAGQPAGQLGIFAPAAALGR